MKCTKAMGPGDDNQNQIGPVLFVGAFAPEIDRLNPKTSALEAGIGSVAAAIRLQEHLLEAGAPRPAEVVFLGSAGVYAASHDYGPGHFGWSRRFCKRDLSALLGQARQPAATGDVITTAAGSFAESFLQTLQLNQSQSLQFHEGICNSTDSVSLIELDVTSIQIDFENLEAYGLAAVCLRYALPFTALFALTNRVGPSGSDEWRNHFRSMSDALQNVVNSAL